MNPYTKAGSLFESSQADEGLRRKLFADFPIVWRGAWIVLALLAIVLVWRFAGGVVQGQKYAPLLEKLSQEGVQGASPLHPHCSDYP